MSRLDRVCRRLVQIDRWAGEGPQPTLDEYDASFLLEHINTLVSERNVARDAAEVWRWSAAEDAACPEDIVDLNPFPWEES